MIKGHSAAEFLTCVYILSLSIYLCLSPSRLLSSAPPVVLIGGNLDDLVPRAWEIPGKEKPRVLDTGRILPNPGTHLLWIITNARSSRRPWFFQYEKGTKITTSKRVRRFVTVYPVSPDPRSALYVAARTNDYQDRIRICVVFALWQWRNGGSRWKSDRLWIELETARNGR